MTYKAPADAALIIVDMQNGFCPGGGLPVPDGDEIVPAINRLRASFDDSAMILTQDWHPAEHTSFAVNHAGAQPYQTIQMPYGDQTLWPVHCVQNTADAAFHPDLKISPAIRVIRKGTDIKIDSYSAFRENDKKSSPRFDNGKTLGDTLRNEGRKILVLCGLAYDFCVGYSALDARAEGFDVIVVKGATRSIAMGPEGGPTTEDDMDKKLKTAGVIVIDATHNLRHAIAAIKPRQNLPAAIISILKPE